MSAQDIAQEGKSKTQYSVPLSTQVASRGLGVAEARTAWQDLSYSFEIPEGVTGLRVWVVAVNGGGAMHEQGWKGGRPTLLLDDFELKTQVPLEEIPIPVSKKIRPACP